jgi:hypothetical protein
LVEGDKVFLAEENCFAEVYEKYTMKIILKCIEDGKQKYVETYPFKPGRNGMAGKYAEPTEGIHYEVYWMLEGDAVLADIGK